MHPAYEIIDGLAELDGFEPQGLSNLSKSVPTTADDEDKTIETSSLLSESSSERSFSVSLNSKVKFDLTASTTHQVQARHEMDEEDFKDIWFHQSDFASIASRNRMTVRMYRQHILECLGCDRNTNASSSGLSSTPEHLLEDLDDHQCIRGLEHRLKGEQSKRNEIRTNAIYSVLGEQARQKREKLPVDEMKLATLYKEHTYAVVADAIQLGNRDARTAKALALPQENKRVSRTSGLIHALDDCDIRALDYDDNSSSGGVEELPLQQRKQQPRGGDDDDDSFRAKAKREKRGSISFARFFKGSSSKKSKSKDSKKKQQKKSEQPPELLSSPPPVRRRKCRRSSM